MITRSGKPSSGATKADLAVPAASARPVVICFSGHDPSGGAGIQADIEAIAATGCHAAPLITAMTDQDSRGLYGFQPTDASWLRDQANHIMADLQPSAIKVGMVGSSAALAVVVEIAREYSDLPLILDPVLAAGSGGQLSGPDLASQLSEQLLPICTLVTPNSEELVRLCPSLSDGLDPAVAAAQLLQTDCCAVLVTGTHLDSVEVVNTLYRLDQPPLARSWPRLSGEYHGSGCTLTSYIAGLIAQGDSLENATLKAQQYTWNALNRADQLGKGQLIPNRMRNYE